VLGIALSPDGSKLVSAGENGELKYWDVGTGSLQNHVQAHSDRINSIVFSANGAWLASASRNGRIKVWNAKSGTEIASLRGHTEAVTVLAFHPERALLASGSWDGLVMLWDISTGKLIHSFVGHGRNTVWSLAFNKKGTMYGMFTIRRVLKLSYKNLPDTIQEIIEVSILNKLNK